MGAQCCKDCVHNIRCWRHDECIEDLFVICCCLPCECYNEYCFEGRKGYTEYKNEK